MIAESSGTIVDLGLESRRKTDMLVGRMPTASS